MSVATQAQAAETTLENATLRSKSSRPVTGFQRTEAIVESTNIINTFVLAFSDAVRSGGQADKVAAVQATLARNFSISLVFGTTVLGPATDFASLQALIQGLGTGLSFDASLSGNLSLESLTRCHGRRTVQMQGLEYVVQTQQASGLSTLLPALDQWTIVETRRWGFRVKTLVATVISNPIPFGTPAP